MTIAAALAGSKSLGEAVRILQAAQRQELLRWKGQILQEALETLVALHLGQRWQRRIGPTPWVCKVCGPREAQQVKRNGHYRRALVVMEGNIALRVPQLRCLGCGKPLALDARFLPARRRFWGELDRTITEAYLSGASYRQVKALVEGRIQSNVGLMSLWQRFQERAKGAQSPALGKPLKVLYLDEAYLRVGGQARWGLLALGEARDGTRHYLGASVAPQRSEEAWVELLDRLGIPDWGRGLVVVHDGDQAIAGAVAMVLPKAEERRCLWHQLQNLFHQARERFPQERGRRQEFIQQRRGALEASLDSPPRTTSPLERGIKELRRRIRPMDGFGSGDGSSTFLRAWMVKENIRRTGGDWLEAFMI